MDRKLTFEAWFAAVDKCILDKYGFSVHDLPDKPWRKWYDIGVKPCLAARHALREEGCFDE